MIQIENPRARVWQVIRDINLDYGKAHSGRRRMRYCMACEGGIGIMAHRYIPERCPHCGGLVTVSDEEIVKGLQDRNRLMPPKCPKNRGLTMREIMEG